MYEELKDLGIEKKEHLNLDDDSDYNETDDVDEWDEILGPDESEEEE